MKKMMAMLLASVMAAGTFSRSRVRRSEVPNERQNSHGYGLETVCRKAG